MVNPALPVRSAKRSAIVNSWRIIEDGNRWYAELRGNGRRGEVVLITDFVIRIDRRGNDGPRLVGRVLTSDDEVGIPFNVSAGTLKQQGWRAWFIRFLERHGKRVLGCLNGPNVSWIDLATAFCTPADEQGDLVPRARGGRYGTGHFQ